MILFGSSAMLSDISLHQLATPKPHAGITVLPRKLEPPCKTPEAENLGLLHRKCHEAPQHDGYETWQNYIGVWVLFNPRDNLVSF